MLSIRALTTANSNFFFLNDTATTEISTLSLPDALPIYVDGNLHVDKAAALTVTANDKSKVYGAADPTLTYTVTGTRYYDHTSQHLFRQYLVCWIPFVEDTADVDMPTASRATRTNYVDTN